jgi:hypothetical protein
LFGQDRLLCALHSLNDELFRPIILATFLGEIVMTNASNKQENGLVHLKVNDYAKWRSSFDGSEKSRVAAGITNGKVFRSAEDQNDLVILADVADEAKARTFMASDEQKAQMQARGVIGSPTIRFAA